MRRYIIFFFLMNHCLHASFQIEQHVSTRFDSPWEFQNIDVPDAHSPSVRQMMEKIEIIPTQAYQTIEGFGGSFNEMGGIALNYLDRDDQNEVMRALFSDEDCGFSVCRMSIGSNDFSAGYYSLNDHAFDYEMKHFSIERDQKVVIPYIKKAMQFEPELKVWGSPWSPPIWMKQNRHYGGKAVNENWGQLQSAPMDDITPLNRIVADEKTFAAYALYFRKYVEAYREQGIDVFAIQPQNEVFANQLFPSCLWDASVMREFLENHLIPELTKLKQPVELWLGTINSDRMDWVETVLESGLVSKRIEGIGVQWRGLDMLDELQRGYPDLQLMQTESECNNGSNDWNTAKHTYDLMHHCFSHGVSYYMYWNMILDETGFSNWVWRQNSMISIDRFEKTVTYNPEFYVMKHLSHFVKPGAVRIHVNDGDEFQVMAFENPDESIVISYKNGFQEARVIEIQIGESQHLVNLRPDSIGTIELVKP